MNQDESEVREEGSENQQERGPESPEQATPAMTEEELQRRSQATQEMQKLEEASFHQANPDAFDLARSEISRTGTKEERARKYEEVLKNKDYIDKEKATEMAEDLTKLEEAFINDGLRQEITALLDGDEAGVEKAVNDIKGSLFEIILAGQITADQLIATANLGIHIGDVGEGHVGKIVNNKEGSGIVLSKKFLEDTDDRRKAHYLSHEFGHGVTEKRAFWSHQQMDLMKAACFEDFEGDTSKLSPELKMILQIVKDPDNSFLITNKYITERLDGIKEAKDVGQERFDVAKEIMAEMLGSYMLDGSTLSHYMANRMKCMDEAGWARIKALADKKGIAIDENLSPVQKILELNKQGLFGEEFKAFDHFSKTIGKRNEDFEVSEDNPFLENPYEIYDDEAMYGGMGGYGDEHWAQGGSGADQKTPFDKLFDLFKIPTKEIKFGLGGGGKGPAMPKAA